MKKTIALLLAVIMCVSVTACGTGNTEAETVQEQTQPQPAEEVAAIQEDSSEVSETDNTSDVKVAKDGADMQTEDKSMPTRIPMEGGTKINMYFGDTLITGVLNDCDTAKAFMRLIDTNIRINAVAPGATVTPAHLANKAGKQPGGAKMLEYSKHFVYFPGPECDPLDQANACLFLASDMGKHVKGQVIQVCNGAFL